MAGPAQLPDPGTRPIQAGIRRPSRYRASVLTEVTDYCRLYLLRHPELATHGIAIMSVREGLDFESTIVSDTQPLKSGVRCRCTDQMGLNLRHYMDRVRCQ